MFCSVVRATGKNAEDFFVPDFTYFFGKSVHVEYIIIVIINFTQLYLYHYHYCYYFEGTQTIGDHEIYLIKFTSAFLNLMSLKFCFTMGNLTNEFLLPSFK